MGGLLLHFMMVTLREMRTGEGKTLPATMPAYLTHYQATGVHVVTVNEYLATRDGEMGEGYKLL